MPEDADGRHPLLIISLLFAVVFAAYASGLRGPFVLDDRLSIIENPSIQSFSPPWRPLDPPAGEGLTVEGRPVLNLSLAMNFAVNGTHPTGYRIANVLIHGINAVLVFLLVRAVARLQSKKRATAARVPPAGTLAVAVAFLWAVHPINTIAVTYIIQRAESLMGLFLFSTLYAFHRAITRSGQGDENYTNGSRRLPLGWCTAAVVACALGMGTKEVMVGAPLIALFHDRTFVSGSFRRAWQQHSLLYVALAATWLVLAWLALGAGDRGGTIGAAAGVTPWQYALAQSHGIFHYIKLIFWPCPLIFDYGPENVGLGDAIPYLLALSVLLIVTAHAFFRRTATGFLGATFFVLLAPTSSFVGGYRQMLAEHRMYLPSVVVITLSVLTLYRISAKHRAALGMATVAGFAVLTIHRNLAFRSELTLWEDTVAKRPGNPFAQYNLGKLLAESGNLDAAIAANREAIRLRPGLVGARLNLANALSGAGKLEDALVEYRTAIELKPDYSAAHYNLANALVKLNRKPEAAAHYRLAVENAPSDLEARDNLGAVLMDLHRLAEAETELKAVLSMDPDRAETHYNLGTVYFLQSRFAEAAHHYREALRIKPGFPPALQGLARLKQ